MNLYQNWFLASRPWSFTMTAISVGVGSALAAIDGPFSWHLFILALTGAVFMHAAANLFNDYYDVKHGVDTVAAATAQYRPHPLVQGLIPARQVFIAASVLLGTAGLIGLYLTFRCGWPVFWIGLAGSLAAVAYTAPPMKYKYVALGEVSVFLMWGPLMVEGAYYVQRHALSARALLISLPFGVLVALVLLANNIRDIEHDRSRHIRTLANILGQRSGMNLYLMFMVAAFTSIPLFIILGVLPVWGIAIFLSLPIAVKLLRQMVRMVPADADAQTAKLDTAFGVLLLIVLVIQGLAG
ncbi:MAG: 1,4-dihydroxy-2-naphthoate octaprenyltransferase [Desulfobacterota bacterium]|nr:1,4-dihydroxy-2-naphthoate octaprenyltransferase [Thermodesulfobacteriota bacterium]